MINLNNNLIMIKLIISLLIFKIGNIFAHSINDLRHWEIASNDPDRIYLSFNGNTSNQMGVSWRTKKFDHTPIAEIALSLGSPDFDQKSKKYVAKTEEIDLSSFSDNTPRKVLYHSTTFTNLTPNTLYAYRVGNGKEFCSEWIQFKTASNKNDPFSFIYFGDAQNDILNKWSRTIRMAQKEHGEISFFLHAGDLVDKAHYDHEWAAWFKAGSFLHAQYPGIPVLGNHEYDFDNEFNLGEKIKSFLWRPQFNLPVEKSLPIELHETCYYVDYNNTRIIILNSNKLSKEQDEWLEKKLHESKNDWLIVSFHHPIFPPAGRNHYTKQQKEKWINLFNKYNVDLVLQGHDHSYVRGHIYKPNFEKNIQTVYVTSVSGPKQYPINKEKLLNYKINNYKTDFIGENGQFFQKITINKNHLNFECFLSDGCLYDRITINKDLNSGKKRIIEN